MIDLGDGYVIQVDDYNYTFGKLVRTKRGEQVRAIGYYSRLPLAIKDAKEYLLKRELGVDEPVTLADIEKTIKELDTRFDKRLEGITT